jgi:hypothetical protein
LPIDSLHNRVRLAFLSAAGSPYRCIAVPASIPISKNYLLTYPDGSRKHIARAERDELLLAGLAKQTTPRNYLFTGREYTFRSFADLRPLAEMLVPTNLRRFLPGSFVFEHDGKRHSELMETPEACACRLKLYGEA